MPKTNTKNIRKALLGWYDKNRRDLPWRQEEGKADPYVQWVSEVMLQQTRVRAVIPYFLRFMERFPKVTDLAGASEEAVLKLWEGLGYYSRARNMHKAAIMIVSEHGGKLPQDPAGLLALPGVGDYIAAAVASIAFNYPAAVADGNVKRVLSRLFLMETPVNVSSAKKAFTKKAARLLDQTRPGDFNQALMEMGALICSPKNPKCGDCPVIRFCGAWARNKILEFPKRKKTAPVPTHHAAVGVIYKKDRVLITKRRSEGLLGGLWEFPGGKMEPGETPETACLREIKEETGLTVEIAASLTTVRHAYTHFKVILEIFTCRYVSGKVRLTGPTAHKWVKLPDLSLFPFGAANRKFMDSLPEGP